MNKPKRHHFNPCVHLRNFAGNEPPGHFYAVERPDGTMDTSIEERLSGIEGEAGEIYKALLDGRIPTDPKERINFAHSLGVMYARTPTMRRLYHVMQLAGVLAFAQTGFLFSAMHYCGLGPGNLRRACATRGLRC